MLKTTKNWLLLEDKDEAPHVQGPWITIKKTVSLVLNTLHHFQLCLHQDLASHEGGEIHSIQQGTDQWQGTISKMTMVAIPPLSSAHTKYQGHIQACRDGGSVRRAQSNVLQVCVYCITGRHSGCVNRFMYIRHIQGIYKAY